MKFDRPIALLTAFLAFAGGVGVTATVLAGGGNDGTTILPFGDDDDDDDESRSGGGSSGGMPGLKPRFVVLEGDASVHLVSETSGLKLPGFSSNDLRRDGGAGSRSKLAAIRIVPLAESIDAADIDGGRSLALAGEFIVHDAGDRDSLRLCLTGSNQAVLVVVVGERDKSRDGILTSFVRIDSMLTFVVERAELNLHGVRDFLSDAGSGLADADIGLGLITIGADGVDQAWSAFDL